ncbi:MAG: tryptophan--tRNA ligase [Spirochaetes bacterium]|nr:tryptophan--tRNA ligase [Spirochaetota bacterium]
MKTMLSGIQPTGDLHLGNYLGAIKNWVRLLDEYYGYFFIVDYHAITIPYDVASMQPRILDAAVEYLASGLDPSKCIIYVQSHVPAHTELTWILNSVTPIMELERMTQYKDKAEQHKENINAGLFTYPTLMAADILLYHPDAVPVGEDQVQHLELTRVLARKFNARYGEYFKEPKTLMSEAKRILGLDGKRKMSKSLNNHIPLKATAEQTEKLLLGAVTDPDRKRRSDPGNPDVCNIYSLHKLFTPAAEYEECAKQCRCAGIGCVDCKKILAKHMNAALTPVRERITAYAAKKDFVIDVLRDGAKKANEVANKTLREVKSLMGLIADWQ